MADREDLPRVRCLADVVARAQRLGPTGQIRVELSALERAVPAGRLADLLLERQACGVGLERAVRAAGELERPAQVAPEAEVVGLAVERELAAEGRPLERPVRPPPAAHHVGRVVGAAGAVVLAGDDVPVDLVDVAQLGDLAQAVDPHGIGGVSREHVLEPVVGVALALVLAHVERRAEYDVERVDGRVRVVDLVSPEDVGERVGAVGPDLLVELEARTPAGERAFAAQPFVLLGGVQADLPVAHAVVDPGVGVGAVDGVGRRSLEQARPGGVPVFPPLRRRQQPVRSPSALRRQAGLRRRLRPVQPAGGALLLPVQRLLLPRVADRQLRRRADLQPADRLVAVRQLDASGDRVLGLLGAGGDAALEGAVGAGGQARRPDRRVIASVRLDRQLDRLAVHGLAGAGPHLAGQQHLRLAVGGDVRGARRQVHVRDAEVDAAVLADPDAEPDRHGLEDVAADGRPRAHLDVGGGNGHDGVGAWPLEHEPARRRHE